MAFKFFNPFKPHIAYIPSYKGFAVRRWRLGWEYFDNGKINETLYWWGSPSNARYFVVGTPEIAAERIERYCTKKSNFSKLYAY